MLVTVATLLGYSVGLSLANVGIKKVAHNQMEKKLETAIAGNQMIYNMSIKHLQESGELTTELQAELQDQLVARNSKSIEDAAKKEKIYSIVGTSLVGVAGAAAATGIIYKFDNPTSNTPAIETCNCEDCNCGSSDTTVSEPTNAEVTNF